MTRLRKIEQFQYAGVVYYLKQEYDEFDYVESEWMMEGPDGFTFKLGPVMRKLVESKYRELRQHEIASENED